MVTYVTEDAVVSLILQSQRLCDSDFMEPHREEILQHVAETMEVLQIPEELKSKEFIFRNICHLTLTTLCVVRSYPQRLYPDTVNKTQYNWLIDVLIDNLDIIMRALVTECEQATEPNAVVIIYEYVFMLSKFRYPVNHELILKLLKTLP